MLFIPYHTDAPVAHFPATTLGLIAANIYCFAATAAGKLPLPDQWWLAFGQGLRPHQWLTHSFMHAGVPHLLGNMLFLWGFGLVVEGKLGPLRFLACYLGLAAVSGMIEQVLMLGYDGLAPAGALGASDAIYGLVAIALIWAPKNEMSCLFLFIIYPFFIDIPILYFASFYIGWELLTLWTVDSFSMGSAALHVIGAVVGTGLGFLMLRNGWVDCEGWDVISLWKADAGSDRREKVTDQDEKVAEHKRQQRELVPEKIDFLLQHGNVEVALQQARKTAQLDRDFRLTEKNLLGIVTSLHRAERFSDSVPFMAAYLRNFERWAPEMRLKLAQILIQHQQRPAKALEVLAELPAGELPQQLEEARGRLIAAAQQMRSDGELEVDRDDW